MTFPRSSGKQGQTQHRRTWLASKLVEVLPTDLHSSPGWLGDDFDRTGTT